MKFALLLVAAASAIKLTRTPAQQAEIEQMTDAVYEVYDTDNSGTINGTEFETALGDLTGQDINVEEANQMFDIIDQTNDGEISKPEFTAVLEAAYN